MVVNEESCHNIESEINDYLLALCLSKESDPLSYWKEKRPSFPLLGRIAAKYLSIPATSAPVEKLFSVAGKFIQPERCRLTDTVFEKLIYIECNASL